MFTLLHHLHKTMQQQQQAHKAIVQHGLAMDINKTSCVLKALISSIGRNKQNKQCSTTINII
jgi:hypothetical protein